MERVPGNDFATTKLVAHACKVADQRKVCKGTEGRERRRAVGRLETKVDELVEAVDEYRASPGGQP